jgi:hypothetical protein
MVRLEPSSPWWCLGARPGPCSDPLRPVRLSGAVGDQQRAKGAVATPHTRSVSGAEPQDSRGDPQHALFLPTDRARPLLSVLCPTATVGSPDSKWPPLFLPRPPVSWGEPTLQMLGLRPGEAIALSLAGWDGVVAPGVMWCLNPSPPAA